MDQQQWTAPGFYGYYPDDPHADRTNTSPSSVQMDNAGPSGVLPEDVNPRRYSTQSHHSASLPPPHFSVPPPLLPQTATPTSLPHSSSGSGSSSVALPSFSSGFYSPYHSHSPSTNHTAHAPHTAHIYPAHLPYAPGSAPASYHIPNPMSAPPLPTSHPSRQPPIDHYAESRLPHLIIDSGIAGPGPGGGGGSHPGTMYRSPADTDHLSPISPLHPHLTGIPSTASSGSSHYPLIPPIKKSTSNSGSARGSLRAKGKRKEASPMDSSRSWSVDGEGDSSRAEDGSMPWGMPQNEYKALNPKDKKQVRNRIGARRFRAKRKDYVATLEASARVRDEQIAALQNQLEAQQNEINDYRQQLGLPLVHPKVPIMAGPGPENPGGLGLMVPMEEWEVGKVERD